MILDNAQDIIEYTENIEMLFLYTFSLKHMDVIGY